MMGDGQQMILHKVAKLMANIDAETRRGRDGAFEGVGEGAKLLWLLGVSFLVSTFGILSCKAEAG